MKRRDFLRSSGWFVVGAALVGLPGCGDNSHSATDAGADGQAMGVYQFPQGVASGDPRSNSVVLWTRVVRGDETADVTLRLLVATDPGFATVVVDKVLTATAASDHTVRVLVNDLKPATAYYYRFIAGGDSRDGQTLTAPDADADVQINLAWVSCQDYAAGNYGAYRQMLNDDAARAVGDRIHAIVHLGDMIYETRADGFQTAIDENFKPIALSNRDGSARVIPALPSGTSATFATTVEDYRLLYKTYFSDPDIQAVRARWPMIAVWDDHEFTDDCWQSQANYTDTATLDEGSQKRRVSASQAWFEYTPALLTGAIGVVPNQAKDFAATTVVDAQFTAPDDDNFTPEENNAKAVSAITIYRSFRFGKHVELVMTDQRSYRSDHAVPEELVAAAPAGTFFAPRNAMPLLLVNQFDAGKTANNNNPQQMVGPFPNPRFASPPGTMLGKAQKEWWKATMKGSTATWKLWGSEVSVTRLRVPKLNDDDFPTGRVVTADAWDGYPTERKELMSFLKTEGIHNVVVLAGDIHASFASTIFDDFDATGSKTTVACELVAAGISSNSLFSFFEAATRGTDDVTKALRPAITVDASPAGGPKFVETFNTLLLNGVGSVQAFVGTLLMGKPYEDARQAAISVAAVDPTTNPHVKYVDSNAQGYGYVKVTAAKVDATIVTINRPISPPSDAGPGIKRTASFSIPAGNPDGMTGPELVGTKPFPLA